MADRYEARRTTDFESVEVAIDAGDWELRGTLNVPARPVTLGDLLPAAIAIAEAVVAETIGAVERAGAMVSCGPGCGACCRMLANVSEVEARAIRRLIDSMPAPRRSEILSRFAGARERLAAAGLLDDLRRVGSLDPNRLDALTGAYFALRIACPFLEDESCSIHPDRPVTCREYLVTSDPVHCAEATGDRVVRVGLPLKTFNALARWGAPATGRYLERIVPLILAPEWAAAHPDDPPPRPGGELLREFAALLEEQARPDATND